MVKLGCKFYWDCFTCPFPDCMFDSRISTIKRFLNLEKAKQLNWQGFTRAEIAQKLGVCYRTVERYEVLNNNH